jgi:hypothetical protein
MTGVADRIWAKVALKPGTKLEARSSPRGARTTGTNASEDSTIASAGTPESTASGSPADSNTEIRETWMRGDVALHEDADPAQLKDGAKAKGQDITGDALYMLNRGEGKMIARVYQRNPDPRDGPPRPGPLPLAKVSNDEKTIEGEILRMDQEHDKVWVDGPGTLTQWTDRALLTDKAPEPAANRDGTPATSSGSAASRGDPLGSPASSPSASTRLVSRTDSPAGPAAAASTPPGPATASQPRTRAGRLISDKDLLTITWTQRMEFTGRTTDTTGRPAGKAEFYGMVNAQMEDSQLKCDERMVVFTDREVPLAQLGSLSKSPTKAGGSGGGPANEDGTEDAGPDSGTGDQPQVDLAMIYCFGKSLAVSRKIDPDAPIVNQQQMILAERRLDYNRRTGEFYVPCPGKVFLYDRSDRTTETAGLEPGRNGDPNDRAAPGNRRPSARPATPTGRAVTPTASRATTRTTGAPPASGTGRPATAGRGRPPTTADATRNTTQRSQPAEPTVTPKVPPLILTQIFFSTGMHGRFGTGQVNDTQRERWSEFFGDIELERAEVVNERVAFDFDKELPPDGFFLTSQILRVIQEPPPPGAPASTPTRSFLKAWDKVTVKKGEAEGLLCDVAIYDSSSDLIHAYGEAGRGVTLVQQNGLGQPASTTTSRAVRYNTKTGAANSDNADTLHFFDKKTGVRPTHIPPPDPNAKPKKRGKLPYRLAPNNWERRGFTGQ